jgi:2-oxoglutarate dehydrogenase E1 component
LKSDKLIEGMDSSWATSELTGLNSAYLESVYEQYLENPASVAPEIRAYFTENGFQASSLEQKHSQIQEKFRHIAANPAVYFQSHSSQSISPSSPALSGSVLKQIGVMNLIEAYRRLGHLKAQLDPLKLWKRPESVELSLSHHGLSESDLDQEFEVLNFGIDTPKALSQASTTRMKLKELIAALERIYCGSIGAEYAHVSTLKERHWLQARFESRYGKGGLNAATQNSEAQQKKILRRLISADGLEKYLGMKYAGQKRFSLEGGDALIPLMKEIIEQAASLGSHQVSIGMAHRGRLNMLVNVLGKPPADLFSEFEGKHSNKLLSGDVKYHNGFSSDIATPSGSVHLSLAFNPSHLEIVAPVVEGSVRARQARRNFDRNKVMACHIHGDAAFAGQGVVMETLAMSQTRAYYTGGSIHVIVNNQVGFTTSKIQDARSSTYCTDIAKMTECPVFHVNSEDPDAVAWVGRLAADYRMEFHKDIVIDLVCYRLHGHNEADEPAATQPLMVQMIKQKKTPWEIYAESLEKSGVIKAGEAAEWFKNYQENLGKGDVVAELAGAKEPPHGKAWNGYLDQSWDAPYASKMDLKKLVSIAKKLDQLPEGFNVQRQVAKMLQDRAKMTQGEMPINWGYAEVLAYATLLNDDVFIRFTGEDVERGTFAHRHAVLNDQVTGETFTPLAQIAPRPGRLVLHNSLLSELAVLAFEYGFACANPEALVIWEAQFGDFVNMAQPVIDQFLVSAEEKWGRLCGLMMLLPHGYEGMGAEHSSARLERFLQLCANDNIQVCVPTTPAQIYHLIRRQVLRPYRKPLVVMSPKSLLRNPECTSSLEDLASGEYQLVIPEVEAHVSQEIQKVRRVILCQGKVYFDLLAARRDSKIHNIAIIRIEQLYPFPAKALEFVLKPYSHVKDIVWCQEEPKNQGAWNIIQHPIRQALRMDQTLSYAGRAAFASPAAGYPSLHKEQQAALIEEALKQ